MELYSISTPLHVCSVETFPGRGDVFACGLYELDEAGDIGEDETQEQEREKQTREGGVMICDALTGATLACAYRTGGVLDMKTRIWPNQCSSSDQRLTIAAAYSTSRVELLEYKRDTLPASESESESESRSYHLSSLCESKSHDDEDDDDNEGLFLSLSWCGTSGLAVSTQQGNVLIYNVDADISALETSSRITAAHTLYNAPIPCWIVACDPLHPHRLFTGGDDCALRLWDVRQACDGASGATASVTRLYTAGVTSGEWHPEREHIFAAGSYDESCHVWDCRSLKAPLPLCSITAGGGVWRTKWLSPSRPSPAAPAAHAAPSYLALACMQGGCSLHRVDGLGSSADESGHCGVVSCRQVGRHVDASANNHLAYGIASLGCGPARVGLTGSHAEAKAEAESERGQDVSSSASFDLISCSFYDNKVTRWSASM